MPVARNHMEGAFTAYFIIQSGTFHSRVVNLLYEFAFLNIQQDVFLRSLMV